MNFVSKCEGHRELIQGFQNMRKDGQTQTDRSTNGSHQSFSTFGTNSLRVGNFAVFGNGHSVSLAPRVREEYSYISTPFLGNYGMLYFENYLLSARRVRRSLLQYIMQSTAVVLIAVLAADISGRTVLRQLLTVLVREVLVVPCWEIVGFTNISQYGHRDLGNEKFTGYEKLVHWQKLPPVRDSDIMLSSVNSSLRTKQGKQLISPTLSNKKCEYILFANKIM